MIHEWLPMEFDLISHTTECNFSKAAYIRKMRVCVYIYILIIDRIIIYKRLRFKQKINDILNNYMTLNLNRPYTIQI